MERWRATCGEGYYWIGFRELRIHKIKEGYTVNNDIDYSTGDYFRTREEAEKALEIIKSALVGSEVIETVEDILKEVDKMAEEHEFTLDEYNYLLEYDVQDKRWTYHVTTRYKSYGGKFITNDENQAIDIIRRLNQAQEREMSNG